MRNWSRTVVLNSASDWLAPWLCWRSRAAFSALIPSGMGGSFMCCMMALKAAARSGVIPSTASGAGAAPRAPCMMPPNMASVAIEGTASPAVGQSKFLTPMAFWAATSANGTRDP